VFGLDVERGRPFAHHLGRGGGGIWRLGQFTLNSTVLLETTFLSPLVLASGGFLFVYPLLSPWLASKENATMNSGEFFMLLVLVLLVGAACWGVIAKVCVGDSIVSTALSAVMAAVGLFVTYVLVTSY